MKETSIRIHHHNRCVHGIVRTPDSPGKHPLIIFSHGYNGCMDDFGKSAEFFAIQGFVSVTFTFCGGSTADLSDYPSTSMSLMTEKEDLGAVLARALTWDNVDSGKVFLFGGSQGGLVSALTAATLQSSVTGLILLFPALCIEDNWAEKFPDIDKMPEPYDFWGLDLGRKYASDVRNLHTFERISQYTGPVMIMHGSDDEVVPFEYSVKAQSLYQNARLIRFEGEHHGFTPENDRRVDGIAYSFAKEVLERC